MKMRTQDIKIYIIDMIYYKGYKNCSRNFETENAHRCLLGVFSTVQNDLDCQQPLASILTIPYFQLKDVYFSNLLNQSKSLDFRG